MTRGVLVAAGFQDRELAARVDLQIGEGVGHGVHVADLAGQVEDHILALNQGAHGIGVAHVGNVDLQAIFVAGDVEAIAAIVGDERVDQGDAGAQVDQPPGEVGADKAQAAGDEHGAACVVVEIGHEGDYSMDGRRRRSSGAARFCMYDHSRHANWRPRKVVN